MREPVAILAGTSHQLVWYPRSKLSGHLRAILWALLAAGFLALGEVMF